MTQNTLGSSLQAGGCVVFWKSAAKSSKDVIDSGLQRLGLEKHQPDERKAPALLHAALGDVLSDVTAVIRPLKKRAGWQIFLEEKGEKQNVLHDHGCAYVNGSDSWSGFTFEGKIGEKSEDIHRSFLEEARWVGGGTVSTILIDVLKSLGGITLRQSGSVYWLPIEHRQKWEEVCNVFELAAQHAGDTMIHNLEVRFDPSAVRAVAEGVSEEIGKEISEIYERLTTDGGLRESTSKKLHERIAFLKEKAASYEGALGQSLESIRKQVDQCMSTTAMANLLASTQQRIDREKEADGE